MFHDKQAHSFTLLLQGSKTTSIILYRENHMAHGFQIPDDDMLCLAVTHRITDSFLRDSIEMYLRRHIYRPLRPVVLKTAFCVKVAAGGQRQFLEEINESVSLQMHRSHAAGDIAGQ